MGGWSRGHGDCAVAGVATAVGWRDLSDPEPKRRPTSVAGACSGILLYLDGETMVSRNPAGTNHVLGLLAVAVGVAAITMAVGSVLMQERR